MLCSVRSGMSNCLAGSSTTPACHFRLITHPSSDVQTNYLCSNICPLFLQVPLEVVTDHMPTLCIRQVDTSRMHPLLKDPYITYSRHYSCAAPEESAQAADTKGCHSPEDKKVKQIPARQAPEQSWEKRKTHCRSILLLKIKCPLEKRVWSPALQAACQGDETHSMNGAFKSSWLQAKHIAVKWPVFLLPRQ